MSSVAANFNHPRTLALLLLAQLPVFAFMLLSPAEFVGFCAVLLGAGCIFWLAADYYRIVFLFFLLIAWFPEYSQTDWDVWSAEDFHSLYNYKPIAWLTASVFDYLFALAVLIWLVKIGWPERERLRKAMLAKPMLWFLGFSVFSLLWGIGKGFPVYYALREFRVSAYFVLFYFMALSILRKSAVRERLVQILVWTGIAVGVVGIVRYRLGIGKEYYGETLIYYDIADSMVMYLALFVLASYWLIRRRAGLLVILLSCPILFSLLFSYRRGAWLACAAGLLILIWVYRSKSAGPVKRGRWLAPALVLGAVLVALYAAVDWEALISERLASIVDVYDDTSNVFRIMDTMNAAITFARHPILGLGSGGQYDFEYYSEAVAPAIFWENASRACHNGYLYILYKMGIFGFIAYLTIFVSFVRRWFKLRRHTMTGTDRIMYYGLGAGALAIMVNNITSPVSDSLRPALLLALALGCLVALMTDISSHERIVA